VPHQTSKKTIYEEKKLMNKIWTRLFSLFLVVVLAIGIMPVQYGYAEKAVSIFSSNSTQFVSSAIELVQSNWEDDYFSLITIPIGSTEMYIDGRLEEMSAPAFEKAGEIMLPVADIAESVGADIHIDDTMEKVTVIDDGQIVTFDSELYSFSRISTVPEEPAAFSYSVTEDSTIDDSTAVRTAFFSANEAETALGLDIRVDDEKIFITKPYQLKQIVLFVNNGDDLNNSYGAIQYVTNNSGLYFLQYSSEKLTQSAFEAFKSDSSISFVTLNDVVHVSETAIVNETSSLTDRWGSERISADLFMNYLTANNKTGELIVAVTDTGVDVTHPHLQGRTVAGYNFINNNNSPYDVYSHGTHVSGTIVDCTPPNVKIMPVKILDDGGYGNDFIVCLGIEYAVNNGAKVINMSFGGTCYDNEEDCIYKQVINYAENRGVTCVAAAGNESGDTAFVHPAKLENIITVSALTYSDTSADFTNYGDAIDVCAPGVNILSSIPDGGYGYKSGTSMAAPHISAAAAMMTLEYPGYSPQSIKAKIRNTTVDLGPPGWDRVFGTGALDFRIFFGANIPATGLSLSYSSVVLEIGALNDAVYLSAFVSPSNATDKSVRYSSSNENVAVYKDAMIVPKGEGTAVITATTATGISRTCYVTVTASRNWIDYAADSYSGGYGTKEYPYLIATAEQLAKLAYETRINAKSYRNEYFKLVADIDLEGLNWTSIYYQGISGNMVWEIGFQGIFDGDGHTVTNMVCSVPEHRYYESLGLFGQLGSGRYDFYVPNETEIKNLAVTNAKVTSDNWSQYYNATGILCGGVSGNVKVSNCYTTGESSGGALASGLLENCVISNCYSTAKAGTAGLVRGNNGSIYNSYAAGKADTFGFVDNQQSFTTAAIVNSFSVIDVTSGIGFMGTKLHGFIRNCYFLSSNTIGIEDDQIPSQTTLYPMTLDFFKNQSNYTNNNYWDSEYPWDFDNVWAIDANYNNGLPYLRIFRDIHKQAEKVTAPMSNTADGIVARGTLVTLYSETSGAEIRYTTNGTRPTSTSTLYTAPITITADTTINAIAYKASLEASVVSTFIYMPNTTGIQYWIERAADTFAGGIGTKSDPYLIANAEQLAKLAFDSLFYNKTFSKTYFRLTNDIDLSGRTWVPIGTSSSFPFLGYFDGAGFAVKNMQTPQSLPSGGIIYDQGFFAWIGYREYGWEDEGTVKNLALLDANVSYGFNPCILAYYTYNATIYNCYTTGSAQFAGLIGTAYSTTIGNCYSFANARFGLVGPLVYNSLVHNSYAAGSVSESGFIEIQNTPYTEAPLVINSFAANKPQTGIGFIRYKYQGTIEKCYYLSENSSGVASDSNPQDTDLSAKDMAFFKNKDSYTNPTNWVGRYPWDFEGLWDIDENYNEGLPYLRMFRKQPQVAAPVINITDVLLGKEAHLSCSTEGAAIYATIDGTTPDETSTLITNSMYLQLYLPRTFTIKAIAVKDGYEDSAVTEITLTIVQAGNPTANPVAGAVPISTGVTLNAADFTEIHYTTDGTEPSLLSPKFSTPIIINTATTIKAKTFKLGMAASDMAAFEYKVTCTVSGKVSCYNPKKPTTVRLMQGGEQRYEYIIQADLTASGLLDRTFIFENVEEGTYSLEFIKPVHLKTTIKNISVEKSDINLIEDPRFSTKGIYLPCGDINDDKMINDGDLTILWMIDNYNRKTNDAVNQQCDLNGDGMINDLDLTILWMAANYNRGEIIIE